MYYLIVKNLIIGTKKSYLYLIFIKRTVIEQQSKLITVVLHCIYRV